MHFPSSSLCAASLLSPPGPLLPRGRAFAPAGTATITAPLPLRRTTRRQTQKPFVASASSSASATKTLALFSSPFGLGSGWDNDGYLDSLSGRGGGGGAVADLDDWDHVDFGPPADERRHAVVQPEQPELEQVSYSSGSAGAPSQQWYNDPQQKQQQKQRGKQQYGSPMQQQEKQGQQQQPTRKEGTTSAPHSLPPGWTEYFDVGSGRPYYHNANDGATTWDRPGTDVSGGGVVPSIAADQYAVTGYQGGGGASDIREQSSTTTTWGMDYTEQQGDVIDVAAAPPPSDKELEELGEELPTEDIEGAVLTDEMKAKAKASHTEEEEASQGGSKFRDMMERAKRIQKRSGRVSSAGPSQQQQQQQIQMPPEAMNLPIEEYARLYGELAWRQRNPQAVSGPKRRYLPPGTGIDGRKIGRNRDTETISNKADAYLAQLRRDSTIRTLARHHGDSVTADAEPLSHPLVAEIRAPEENPYLKEQRERERDLIETVPEEMLIFQEYDLPDMERRSDSGISYKEKLAEAKGRSTSAT